MSESDPDALLNKGKAYHEAGHAVLHLIFGTTLVDISIVPNGHIGGVMKARLWSPLVLDQMGVYYEGTPERDRFICHRIMMSLAGEVAQTEFCPESVQPHHAEGDRRLVNGYIKQWNQYAHPHEREAKIEALYEYTRELLTHPLYVAGVHALACTLLECKQLSGDRARTIILGAMNEAAQSAKASGKLLDRKSLKCPHCAEYDQYFE